MLINAQNREELRVAIVSDSVLQDFQLEASERGLNRGNIYRGIVNNIQPSLNAAFINFGAKRDGFLSMQDLVSDAWHRQPKAGRRPRIEDVLERGKNILVQVTRDAEGQKGAALTTSVSLAGRYLVFTPYDDTRGVSRKVEDDEVRRELKEQTANLKVPPGGGFIVRTNALDQNKTTLNKDFAALSRLWKSIQTEYRKGSAPQLLHNDQEIITRTLRDYLDPSIEEVLIDDEAAFNEAEAYVRAFMPRTKVKLTRYAEREPLFSRFGIEQQIERIYERSVNLRSGGSIVIDRTEALIAIDVNSGKSTRAHSQEETALNTNLEAADEVARQLRLRDIGGLVVVDFIDMRSAKHRQLVEKTLREAMKSDKARNNVGRISPNGLLEINRQRLQQALHLRTHRPCPTCSGTGRIASPEMVGLNLLRRIEAKAATTPLKRVRIALHPELADAFQNTRRREIADLEREFDLRVEVIASNRLHRPEQEVEWFEREGAERPQHAAHTPAPLQLPAASHDGEHEGEGRKKRRRRKKNKGQQPPLDEAAMQTQPTAPDDAFEADEELDEPSAVDVDTDESAESASAEPQNGETHESRRRRRRRRRRRHGEGGAAETGTYEPPQVRAGETLPPPELPPAFASFWVIDHLVGEAESAHERRGDHVATENVPSEPVDAADELDELTPDEMLEESHDLQRIDGAVEHRPKRKRRRRRRGGAPAGPATTDVTVAPSEVVSQAEELEALEPEPAVSDESHAAGAAPHKRRKRGRRSRPAAEAPAESVANEPAAAPSADNSTAADEPVAEKPRRPRRPRRKKSTAAVPDSSSDSGESNEE